MSWIVGIDGCKGGWIAAGQEEKEGEVRFSVLEELEDLESAFPGFRLAAIDMPIGLTQGDRREADKAARRFIRPRGSSVFNSLPRPVLAEQDYDSAKARCQSLAGWKPTLQSWGLAPKIIKVDAFIEAPEVRERVWEIHPEVSFRLMLGEGLRLSKHKPEGLELRRGLLPPALQREFAQGRVLHSKKLVEDHDLIDALAALWSGWRILERKAAFFPPEPFEYDSCGRRMVIAG